jgi:hypothetical protein
MATLGNSPYLIPLSGVKQPPAISEAEEKPKQTKSRCCFNGCKKKLSLTDFPCKCGETHCSLHRASEVHNCTYDYKEEHKNILLKTMDVAIVANKIDKI